MIPLLLVMYMASPAPRAVRTTDPKYCQPNHICFLVSYDPREENARIAADTECSRASWEAVKQNKNRSVSCYAFPNTPKEDVFNASETNGIPLATRNQPAPPQAGVSVASGPAAPPPNRLPAVRQQPAAPKPTGPVLGPVLQAAVNKGDCRVYNFAVDCPGFIADLTKDRLERDPKHDGTFEDSPVKLYGRIQGTPEEHAETFTISTTICNARDLARAVFNEYNSGFPIRIVKLRNPDRKDTYLILLSGTEAMNVNQATGLLTDIRLATGQSIRYSAELMAAAKETIPKGSRVILAGHSLGGMVAEKTASDPEWQSLYRTTDVITFGSPQVAGADVAGTRYTRFWDKGDPVPLLSLETRNLERNYILVPGPKDPGMGGLEAHKWYQDNPSLTKFDALGQFGNACLTIDVTQSRRNEVPMTGKQR